MREEGTNRTKAGVGTLEGREKGAGKGEVLIVLS